MEEKILSFHQAIDQTRIFILSNLPLDIIRYAEIIDEILKPYPSILVFLFFFISVRIIIYLIGSIGKLVNLNTYIILFYQFFKGSLLKNKILKERKGIYKVSIEGMKIDKNEAKMKVFSNGQDINRVLRVYEELVQKDKSHFNKENKQTGSVYHNSSDADFIAEKAAEIYAFTDLNFPEIYPSAKKIENSLIDLMLELFYGEKDSCGFTTTGGTDSILQVMCAAKMKAIEKGIKNPNVILPLSIHPAFDKGCQTFGMEIIKVPLTKTYTMDMAKVKSLINKNTVCLVGSGVNYPHGLIDDIQTLNKFALENDIMLHVDSCMGGFLTCFFDEFVKDWNPIDFRLPGVTSISVDVHKYGMTQKGASVILFKNKKIRSLCSFGMVGNEGLFTTAGISCSRSAYLIASAYMSLIHNGKKLYIDQAKRIRSVIMDLKQQVKSKAPKIEIIGDPQVSIISFTSDKISAMYEEMKSKGWSTTYLTNPFGLGFCITSENIKNFENGQFIKDFIDSYMIVYESGKIFKPNGLAAMYGVAAMLPEEVVNSNMDIVCDAFSDTKENLTAMMNKL